MTQKTTSRMAWGAMSALMILVMAGAASARDHDRDDRDGGRDRGRGEHRRDYRNDDRGRGRGWDHHDRGHSYWRNNRHYGLGVGVPWIWGYNPRPRIVEREVIREVPVYVQQPTYYQPPVYSQPVYGQPISYNSGPTHLPNGGQFSGDWYQDNNNRQCREYTTQGVIGGMRQQIYGTACFDGQSWSFNR